MRSPRSLRFRLVAAAVVTAVLGLLVINVVAVLTLRTSLLAQIDTELVGVPMGPGGGRQPAVAGSTATSDATPSPSSTESPAAAPRGVDQQFLDDRVVARLDPMTGVVLDQVTGPGLDGVPAPDLSVLSAAVAAGDALPSSVVDLADVAGSAGAYRVRVLVPPSGLGDGQVLVVAKSLDGMNSTLRRVALVDAGVSLLLVLLLVGVGSLLVRVGLRPLTDVEDAAARVADGDLAVRAPHAAEATEVGSLARTFNSMVDAVSVALDDRDASERRLRQFLADASHELRTPLTSIRAWAELFRQGAIPAEPEALAALARIEADAARMGVLVEDLLLLARLDQQPELRLEQVDLARLVDDVAAALAATSPAHHVRVQVDPGAAVVGDEEALRRVVANLVRNALVHTPGGTHVLVTVHEQPSSVQIDVVDDGPGMSDDVAHQVFERFYRPDSGRSRTGAGSGLGLAIVRSLTEAHGGQVLLDTAPGAGSTFRVVLPSGGPTPDPQRSHSEPTGNLKVLDSISNG